MSCGDIVYNTVLRWLLSVGYLKFQILEEAVEDATVYITVQYFVHM
jgi:hypothetical protein